MQNLKPPDEGNKYNFVILAVDNKTMETCNLKAFLKVDDVPMPSYAQMVMDDFHKKVRLDFEESLKAYIVANLGALGFVFQNDEELLTFVTNRIHRIGFEDKPNYWEIYLDFVDLDNRGTLVGCYSDNVDITYEGNKVTATIGRTVG